MLISMPTCTSTIFGVFQAMVFLHCAARAASARAEGFWHEGASLAPGAGASLAPPAAPRHLWLR
jgi:hypothetical protein